MVTVKMPLYVLAISSLSKYMQNLEQTHSYIGLKKYETTFSQENLLSNTIQLTFSNHHLLTWFCNGVMAYNPLC